MPIDNSYSIRFIGNRQPFAIEDIRGMINEFSDASYIVRYDELIIPNGSIAEIKITSNQAESLITGADGNGIPETIALPSRIILNPQIEDLQAPRPSV